MADRRFGPRFSAKEDDRSVALAAISLLGFEIENLPG
jgi:hypothetical protein